VIRESNAVSEPSSSTEESLYLETLSEFALSEESLPGGLVEESNTLSAEPNNFDRIKSEILSIPGIARVAPCGQGAEGTTLLLTTNTGEQKAGKLVPVTRFFDFASSKIELKEAEILSKVHHPSIAKFDETIEICNGSYLLMVRDYVPGHSLQDVLANHGKLEAAEAEKILRELLGVLGYLHDPNAHPQIEAQIVHRDIKPGNIIIGDQGQVTLVDFGSSHLRGDGYASLTVDARGSIGYMPYEQYTGQATPASDLYALGVTVVECLMEKGMPESLKKNAFSKDRYQIPKSIPMPERMRAALQMMIEPEMENRPKSVSDVLDILDGKVELKSEVSKSYFTAVNEWLYSWVEFASGVSLEKGKNLNDYCQHRDWLSEKVQSEGIVYASQSENFEQMIRHLHECGLRAHISSSELELCSSRLKSDYRKTSERVVAKILEESQKLEKQEWNYQVVERYRSQIALLTSIEKRFEGIVGTQDLAKMHEVEARMAIELESKAYIQELKRLQERDLSNTPNDIPRVIDRLNFLKHISEAKRDQQNLDQIAELQSHVMEQTLEAIKVFEGNLDRYSQQGNTLDKYLSARKDLLKLCESQHLPINDTLIKSLDERIIGNIGPKIGTLLELVLNESCLAFSQQHFYGALDEVQIEKAIRLQEYRLFLAALLDRMLEVTECAVTITSMQSETDNYTCVYVQSSDLNSADELQQFINLKTMKNSSGKITTQHLVQFSENSRGKNLNFPAVTEDGKISKGGIYGFEPDSQCEVLGYRSSLKYYWEQGREGNNNYVSNKSAEEIIQQLNSILMKPTSAGPSKVQVRREVVVPQGQKYNHERTKSAEHTIVDDCEAPKDSLSEEKSSTENSLGLD